MQDCCLIAERPALPTAASGCAQDLKQGAAFAQRTWAAGKEFAVVGGKKGYGSKAALQDLRRYWGRLFSSAPSRHEIKRSSLTGLVRKASAPP